MIVSHSFVMQYFCLFHIVENPKHSDFVKLRTMLMYVFWSVGLLIKSDNFIVTYSTRVKISHLLGVWDCTQATDLVASLPTSRQQVVFALLVPSCQQVWNKLLTVVAILLILSDLLQGCLNKSDTVMI
jgi:hypothetical protein